MHIDTADRVGALSLGGLVSRRALVAAGLDPGLASREIRAGRWYRLAGGVTLTAPGPPTEEQRVLAALVHAGDGSLLCGPSAGRLHALRDMPDDGLVHVLLPDSRRRANTPRVRIHRTRDPVDVHHRRGWPVVAPVRAAVESARWSGSLRGARAVLTAAVADGWCSPDQLEEALRLGGQQGSAHARRAIADVRLGAASAPEAEAADLLAPHVVAGRLPPYLLNPEIWVDGRLLGRVDLWLVGLGLGCETDSVQFHSSAEALDATLLRHARFEEHGLRLLHHTPARLRRDPAAWVAGVLAAAAVRRPEPAGLTVVPRGPSPPTAVIVGSRDGR